MQNEAFSGVKVANWTSKRPSSIVNGCQLTQDNFRFQARTVRTWLTTCQLRLNRSWILVTLDRKKFSYRATGKIPSCLHLFGMSAFYPKKERLDRRQLATVTSWFRVTPLFASNPPLPTASPSQLIALANTAKKIQSTGYGIQLIVHSHSVTPWETS